MGTSPLGALAPHRGYAQLGEQSDVASVSPHTPSARARAEKTLEERIQAIGELVDGLGVAGPLPPPAGDDAKTEAASVLERLLTD
jgi:hypothetical protein